MSASNSSSINIGALADSAVAMMRLDSAGIGRLLMPAIRRILVAVKALDARSLPAVVKATQIARAWGARLELYHGLDTPVYADLQGLTGGGPAALEQQLQQRALKRLEAIAARVRQHGITVTVAAEWDFPAYEAIVRRAVRIRADLIVAAAHAGKHRLPSFMRLTDWELVRLSPIPLLLVKDRHAYRHPAVLAAVDPTHAFAKPLSLDRHLLRMAQKLSLGLRGTLHAVHAYARVPNVSIPSMGLTPGMLQQIEQGSERAARVSFDRVLGAMRIPRPRRYLLASDPIDGIAEAARRSRSAIVVMGAVSRSGLKRLLIGNTAERILDELNCDVLVVKPPKFRNRVPRAARGVQLLSVPPAGDMGYY
jgi:universal stress protein E